MLKFSLFSIDRHILIRGTASPDDPTLRAILGGQGKGQSPKSATQRNQACQRPELCLSKVRDNALQQRRTPHPPSGTPKQGSKYVRDNTPLIHL